MLGKLFKIKYLIKIIYSLKVFCSIVNIRLPNTNLQHTWCFCERFP